MVSVPPLANSTRGRRRTGPFCSTSTSALASNLLGERPSSLDLLERDPVDPELGGNLVEDGQGRRRLSAQNSTGQFADLAADLIVIGAQVEEGPARSCNRGCSRTRGCPRIGPGRSPSRSRRAR